MKKLFFVFYKRVSFLRFAFFIILVVWHVDLSMATVDSNNTEIYLDYSVVNQRTHLKQLKSLDNVSKPKEKSKGVYQYLSKLETKELLETAAELAAEDQLESTGTMLVPHLKKKFSARYPLAELQRMIRDKKHKNKFRAFLLDLITKLPKNESALVGIDSIEVGDPNIDIDETILSLVEDKDNEPELRRYALLQLNRKYIKKELDNDKKERLSKIFRIDKSPGVKGAAITAMRRTESPELEKILNQVLSEPENYHYMVIRHAVVSAAKSNLGDGHVDNLKNIAIAKKNDEIYGSTIYALGLIGSVDAICAIVDIYNQHGFSRIIRTAFRKNKKTILSMLDLGKDDEVIACGVVATRVGQLPSARTLLESIVKNHATKSLQKQAKKALGELANIKDSDIQWKWEGREDEQR